MCQETPIPIRQPQGGIQLDLGPARTHPSAGILRCCDAGASGHQPCLGVTASPASTAAPEALLCPPSSCSAPPSFSGCRHNMAGVLLVSKPSAASAGGTWVHSYLVCLGLPSPSDHRGHHPKDMRGRKGPSSLIFMMPDHHVINIF